MEFDTLEIVDAIQEMFCGVGTGHGFPVPFGGDAVHVGLKPSGVEGFERALEAVEFE